MPNLYVNPGTGNQKLKELWTNAGSGNVKLKELWARGPDGVNKKIYVLGVTPSGTPYWNLVGGHNKETYHFYPQVTFNNGLHINIPWTFDGGVSGEDATAFFVVSVPVTFNQAINLTQGQPGWGLSVPLSYTTGYVSSNPSPKLYLGTTSYGRTEDQMAGIVDPGRFGSIGAQEVSARQTMSLSEATLAITFWLSNGYISAHGSTFAMDIPNEALYILSQGARIPFIFG